MTIVTLGGVSLSQADAVRLPAVQRAISLIGNDLGRARIRILGPDGMERRPAWASLVTGAPNEWQTAHEWRAWMVASAIVDGTAYSYVRRDVTTGEPVEIVPLASPRVLRRTTSGGMTYLVDGEAVDPASLLILYASFPSAADPFACESPLRTCAPALALALAQERAAAAIAQSGATGKLAIMHPGQLSGDAKLALLDAYERKHGNPDGAGRPLVMDEGIKVERVSPSPTEVGLLDDRKYATMEVGRALGVPPQMLYQGDAGALTSQVEMQRQYVDGTLAAWAGRLGAQLTVKLASPGESVTFDLARLTRGNVKDTAFVVRYAGAYFTANEVRDLYDLPATEGGDVFLSQDAQDAAVADDQEEPADA